MASAFGIIYIIYVYKAEMVYFLSWAGSWGFHAAVFSVSEELSYDEGGLKVKGRRS